MRIEHSIRGRGELRELRGFADRSTHGLETLSSPTAATPAPVHLAPRELQVLKAAARGLTGAAIAYELGLKEQTVKHYLGLAYSGLGVDGKIAAFIALGWLKVPD